MPLNEHSLSRLRWIALGASVFALALSGCSDNGSYTPIQGKANFSSVVFMGDSLTAGFQSGSLLDTAQPHGYASLIAQQANFRFVQPLIAPPGAPAVLELQSYDPPNFPVITQASGTTTGRDDISVYPTDVAVPGAAVYDVLNTPALPNPTTDQELITQLVLGFPALLSGSTETQFTLTQQWNPTTVFLWIGNNDALNAVFAADANAATPVTTFQAEYTETVGALATKTSAHLVLCNIPDVTLVPYLIPQAELVYVLEQNGVPSQEAPLLLAAMGINPGDFLELHAVPDFEAELETIGGGGNPTPLPAGDVLHAADAAAIQQIVLQYNQIIAVVAQQVGASLVDIHTVFNNAAQNGVVANGYTATFAFLNGLFSLDGIHPTNTGYAVLANAFIDTLNADLGTSITDVNLDAVAKADPLFPTNFASASVATNRVAALRHQFDTLKITKAQAAAFHRAALLTVGSRHLPHIGSPQR